MPPLKNGSLGRGLGDLMGGLPSTIGVAQHPAPIAKPSAPKRDEAPPVVPVNPQVSLQAPGDTPIPSADRLERRRVQRAWPVVSGMAAMLVLGTGLGFFLAGQRSAPVDSCQGEAPIRYVMVTNSVALPAVAVRQKPLESLDFLMFRPNWIRASEMIRFTPP